MEANSVMAPGGVHYPCQPADADEFTAFIEFMPSAIKASLTEAISMSDGMSDEIQDKALMIRRDRIEPYLKPMITL